VERVVHAIERLAVELERADLEAGAPDVDLTPDVEILEQVPPPIPRIPTQPLGEPFTPLVRPQSTEIIGRGAVGPGGLPEGPRQLAATPSLLRADDALGVLAQLGVDEPVVAPARSVRAFENRSTIAREIDRELSQAERRLFPGQAATPLPFRQLDDFDDALSDIDLDSLAIDTVPGLLGPSALLGVDETRARAPRPREPAPVAPPPRPVQEEGELDAIDVAELVARLHASAFSGALHVERPEGERTFYFDQGDPISARSTLRYDHLAEMLFREGKLSREQVTKLRAADAAGLGDDADGSSRRVALRLVDLGLLKESEIFAVLRRHVEDLFFSLFALEAGHYRMGPSLPAAEERVRLSAGGWALLLEGVRRKYGLERLSARLGGRDAVLHPTTLTPRVIEGAELTADERRIVALIDGTRTLGEVRAALGGRAGEGAVFAVAWALRVAGALDAGSGVNDLRHASTVVTADTAGERRAQPRALDDAQASAERAVERERIASKRAQILDADYFAILGVGRDVSEHELRRAHLRLVTDFDAARFAEEVATEQVEALGEIREVLDEALRVLIHKTVRERYAAHLDPPDRGEP
jgi:hypothetical protein